MVEFAEGLLEGVGFEDTILPCADASQNFMEGNVNTVNTIYFYVFLYIISPIYLYSNLHYLNLTVLILPFICKCSLYFWLRMLTIDILYILDGASLSKIEAKNIPAVSPI